MSLCGPLVVTQDSFQVKIPKCVHRLLVGFEYTPMKKFILFRYCGTQVVIRDCNMIEKPKCVNIFLENVLICIRCKNCYPTYSLSHNYCDTIQKYLNGLKKKSK